MDSATSMDLASGAPPLLARARAVPYYDRTRADPPWVMRAIADSVIRQAQLSNDSRILEIGVGTGRIALVLAKRGLALVGVDLSLPMMGELQNKDDVTDCAQCCETAQ